MKKISALLAFVFFAATVTVPFSAVAGEKKQTKTAAHKHAENKEGSCDMKGEGKKGDCCKMDSKKESTKEQKEESKKEAEKK